MTDGPRCAWCRGRDGDVEEVRVRIPGPLMSGLQWTELDVHARHEAELRRFLARLRARGRRFLSLLGLCVAGLVAAYLMLFGVEAAGGDASLVEDLGSAATSAFSLALAVVLWRHPFATPATNRLLGIRGAIRLVRVLAALLAAGGVWWLARAVV